VISVIVCTYNRRTTLAQTLRSLRELRIDGVDWELILVDNKSTDGTADVLREFAGSSGLNVRIVFEPVQGLSQARNTGIRHASGDIIAFTDDDVLVDPRWLCQLQDTFDKYECAGVGGRIIPLWDAPPPRWLHLEGPNSLRHGAIVKFDEGPRVLELRKPPFGANMSFRREVFESVGPFRTDFGKCGSSWMTGEDIEFCLRLLRSGRKIMYAPGAVIYHRVPQAGLRKRFESHYLSYGRCQIRLYGLPSHVALWSGAPRYLYRTLASEAVQWLMSFDRMRFYHKLQAYEALGMICEARRLHRLRRHGSSSAQYPAASQDAGIY
jgi:GT2 family glycosyltransferase